MAVVGATGFIGRCVCRKLAEQGAQVCPIGREDTGNLESVFGRVHPAIVFNLAGYGVNPSERDEATAWSVNADLPRRLAEALACEDTARLIHVGSGAEYGHAGGDLREDGPASPTTLYGKSKLSGTEAVAERSRALGLRSVIARLFTVYGPGEHAGRLLPSLIECRRTGRPLDLSSGAQRRDFTYVEDAAEGLLRLGVTSMESGAIVNLATGRLATVREFVEIAAGILGIPPENLNFGALSPNIHEMEHAPVAVNRLETLLGWLPPTTIAEGVRKTLEIGLL